MHWLRVFSKQAIDTLFPQECLGCYMSGTLLCDTCKQLTIAYRREDTCIYCNQSSFLGKTHDSCAQYTPLNGFVAVYNDQNVLRKIIHTIKYQSVPTLCAALLPSINERIYNSPIIELFFLSAQTALIPIPLHAYKYWDRGYNQSQVFVEELMRYWPVESNTTLLFRVRNTPSQTTLRRKKRLANMHYAFKVKEHGVAPKTVIIFDDVVTTGATITAAAYALKQAGVQEVWALSLVKIDP